MFHCIAQQKISWARSVLDLRDATDIRIQLNEQLRCLDTRMETQTSIVAELQDFFRRRAEVELDYSKNLEKLSKSLQLRHKEQKQKREQWPLFSSYSCWQELVNQTKTLSKDHAALSEVYSTHVITRLQQVIEDLQRIYKRCKEIASEMQEEILRTLHELHATMKTYHSYQAEARQAETKLRLAEGQRDKMQGQIPKDKLERSKKYRLIGKEVQKRKNKYFDAKLKSLKARNEYVLCLEASNATIHKYFVDDVSDLIDCMDFGFQQCITRCLMMHTTAEDGRMKSLKFNADTLNSIINGMDPRHDKQRFLEYNHSAFMIPKPFEYQGQKDQVEEPELQKLLCADMENRLQQLKQRLTSLRTESEEVWKTLETAESSLLDMLTGKDFDCSVYFGDSAAPVPSNKQPESVSVKRRADRHETEEFYLSKLKEYLVGTSRIVRLDAKKEHIRERLLQYNPSLQSCSAPSDDASPPSLSPSTILESRSVIRELSQLQSTPGVTLLQPPASKPPRRKRIGRLQINGQPKLFGGSLEEYLEATNQEIPLVIKSCIRVINLYGLHHQGTFRVSGSQVEINNFKEAFERGEDPLADMTDASDINSVAGLLKLYLRELREPLFPIIYFEQFMELAQLESKQEFVLRMKDLVRKFPGPIFVFLRYLFAFLNHLSEYSDENMMDPYNLAICFGPTLVPVPEDKDQVQYQNQVNELIKNIILFNEDIFPNTEHGGILYEKYISKEPDDNDVGDSPSDHGPDDVDSEVYPSEDETEPLEATAQFDFNARSEREVTFKKGDQIILYNQVSNDWWKGSVNGREGLIPDKYILIKIKDEEKDRNDLCKSNWTEEGCLQRRRASSSNDSVLSSTTSSSHSPLLNNHNHNNNNSDTISNNNNNNNVNNCWLSPIINDDVVINTKDDQTPIITTEEINTNAKENANDEQVLRVEVQENFKITLMDAPTSKSDSSKCFVQQGSPNLKRVQDTMKSFNENREIWKQRSSSTGSDKSRAKHTPDLVMDLPMQETTKTGSTEITEQESPDMTLAAERFAKQNQCTLKKNTRTGQDKGETKCDKIKPKNANIMVKPQVMRKPILTPVLPPTISVNSNKKDLQKQEQSS